MKNIHHCIIVPSSQRVTVSNIVMELKSLSFFCWQSECSCNRTPTLNKLCIIYFCSFLFLYYYCGAVVRFLTECIIGWQLWISSGTLYDIMCTIIYSTVNHTHCVQTRSNVYISCEPNSERLLLRNSYQDSGKEGERVTHFASASLVDTLLVNLVKYNNCEVMMAMGRSYGAHWFLCGGRVLCSATFAQKTFVHAQSFSFHSYCLKSAFKKDSLSF